MDILFHLLFHLHLLLLLLLPGSSGSLPPPRSSFLLDSGIRPLTHFSLPEVRDTATLLLSPDASTLYVGARDALLSLDVSRSDVIRLRNQLQWSPPAEFINKCVNKGKKRAVDCLNFVHVLQQVNSSVLYACGSFAFSPREAYLESESLSVVHSGDAKGRCPFSPSERSSAIFLDGELFTASSTGFLGNNPQISRFFSKNGRPDVNLDSSISLLEDPTFVSSWSDLSQKKIYFFFSEVGKEFNFVEKLKIARVAQVCKDDVGGQRTLQKKWTSFAKAPLLCQSSKQLPFNVLQDVFTLPPPEGDGDDSETLFYGVFTSQWSTRPESAVCAFRLADFREEFKGNYRTFDMQSHQWSPLVEKHSHLGQCNLASSSDSTLEEVKKNFLTGGAGVKPVGGAPLLVSMERRYSRVAAMRTRSADGGQHTVLFLLTESGFLQKVVLSDSGPRVIEEIQVCTKPEVVQSLVLSPSKGFVYVGTSRGVTGVPVAHCSVHKTCSQCLLARDPLCGWNLSGTACTGLREDPNGGPEELVQDLDGGKVAEKCEGQTTAGEPQVVPVTLGEVVNLRCRKPSNRASVSWTSHRSKVLSKKVFIQSADGSLSFLAAADTVATTYRCEAEEGGLREVVAAYELQLTASPRSFGPPPKATEEPQGTVEPYEDIMTEIPEFSLRPTPEHDGKAETVPSKPDKDWISLTSRQDPLSVPRPVATDGPPPCAVQRSFHRELVVVSLLLVLLVVIAIGGLFCLRFQRRRSRRGDEKRSSILEGCSMSGLEDGGPDPKA
ncbi:unnamed protein product [Ophioblennius macclurei]